MPTYDACRDKKRNCEGYMTVRGSQAENLLIAIFQCSEFLAAARADTIAERIPFVWVFDSRKPKATHSLGVRVSFVL